MDSTVTKPTQPEPARVSVIHYADMGDIVDFNGYSRRGCGEFKYAVDIEDGRIVGMCVKNERGAPPGWCGPAQIESAVRLVNLGLDYKVPIDLLIKKLKMCRCEMDKSVPFGGPKSCHDALGDAIAKAVGVIKK